MITPGDTVDSDERVALVLITGHFIGTTLFDTPRGVSAPGGDELFAAFDTQSGQATDYTLLDSSLGAAPDLSSVGQPVPVVFFILFSRLGRESRGA